MILLTQLTCLWCFTFGGALTFAGIGGTLFGRTKWYS